jgi:hypothetical protein
MGWPFKHYQSHSLPPPFNKRENDERWTSKGRVLLSILSPGPYILVEAEVCFIYLGGHPQRTGYRMAKSTKLDVLINGKWKRTTVEDALAIGERYGRCIECERPARAHSQGRNGAAAHVEHLSWNKKCSLSHRRKNGPF